MSAIRASMKFGLVLPAIVVFVFAACSGNPTPVEKGGSFAIKIGWPQLPASIQEFSGPTGAPGGFRPLAESAPIEITLNRFIVDLVWTDSDDLEASSGYVFPGYRINTDQGIGGKIPYVVKYEAGQSNPVTAGVVLEIFDAPRVSGMTIRLQVFAEEYDPAIFEGEVTNVSTLSDQDQEFTIPVVITQALDSDADGYVIPLFHGTDCNDVDASIHPDAIDVCDGVDSACNGPSDEEASCRALCPGLPLMQGVPAPADGSPSYVGYPEDSEAPRKPVRLAAFCIDQFEVTNKQYNDCGACSTPASTEIPGIPAYYTDTATYGQYPALNINWNQADAYCAAQEKRLPTEFEWEVAARGRGDPYNNTPWGKLRTPQDDGNTPAQTRELHGGLPGPVSLYPEGRSPFGVYNMMGNAAEWTSDWYDPSRIRNLPDAALPIPDLSIDSGLGKTIKGGGWYTWATRAQLYLRYPEEVTATNPEMGFRCAADMPSQ